MARTSCSVARCAQSAAARGSISIRTSKCSTSVSFWGPEPLLQGAEERVPGSGDEYALPGFHVPPGPSSLARAALHGPDAADMELLHQFSLGRKRLPGFQTAGGDELLDLLDGDVGHAALFDGFQHSAPCKGGGGHRHTGSTSIPETRRGQHRLPRAPILRRDQTPGRQIAWQRGRWWGPSPGWPLRSHEDGPELARSNGLKRASTGPLCAIGAQ